MERDYYNVIIQSIPYKNKGHKLAAYQKYEFKKLDEDFPLDLVENSPIETKQINWSGVGLLNAKFKTRQEVGTYDFFDKNKVYYAFSAPCYSSDKKYFIITISVNYKSGGEDTNYIFKKVKDKCI